jgi:cysteine-rich repeat protein
LGPLVDGGPQPQPAAELVLASNPRARPLLPVDAGVPPRDAGAETTGDDASSVVDAGASCGDSIRQDPEECDDGNDSDADSCVDGCRVAGCGDGFVEAGVEACDDGIDDGANGHCSPDCLAGPDGCVDPSHVQPFGAGMQGCGGTGAWVDRALACAAGWHVCSAQEWVDRRGDTVPRWHYWTDDDLWAYEDRSGGFTCWVNQAETADLNPTDCGQTPMRVCASDASAGPRTTGVVDDLGNRCNYFNCGWLQRPGDGETGAYFGGCLNDETAGVLCCR